MPIWPVLLTGLRPINTSLPAAHFATMKAVPVLKSSPAMDIFTRIFPHRLKFQSCRFPVVSTQGRQQQARTLFTTRKFSTRGRKGSGSGSEIRASKSLIDDEADLSDWVSGLNSKSFNKTQLYSDNSDSDNGRDNSRVGDFSRDRGNRDNGRQERGGKRRRESDFDDFKVSNRRGGRYESVESFPRRKGEFNGEWRGERRRGERRANIEGGGNVFSRRKGMESNERFSRGLRDRQSGGNMSRHNGRNSNDRFLRGRGANERSSRGLGNRGDKGVGQGRFMPSDEVDYEDEEEEDEEDEKEKGYMRFKELIDSGESSEDENDGSNDEVVNYAIEKGVFSQAGSDETLRASPSSSPERGDSYLSETR